MYILEKVYFSGPEGQDLMRKTDPKKMVSYLCYRFVPSSAKLSLLKLQIFVHCKNKDIICVWWRGRGRGW